MRHVIIGGGIAGTTCAEELRKRDPNAEITLISEETHPVYSRVLLPHFIKGKVPRERVFLKKEEWYGQQNIDWQRGITAKRIDVRNKFVATSEGREIEYDKLLIAAGGDVRTLDMEDRRGISYFRTIDDADHMLQLLRETPAGTHCGIWGGGFIACEYLNIFAQFGMPTTLAIRSPWFWSNVFDEESGTLLNELLRSKGVEVQTGAAKPPEGAILGVGIGIRPNLDIVKEAGIEVGAGVKANEFLETNVPDVYTAGDIAEFFDPIVERQMVNGNWLNAMQQGRTVAATMAGAKTAFKLVTSYATNAYGLEMIFIGDTSRQHVDEIVMVGSAKQGGVTQVFLRGGRTVGATVVGRNADRAPLTKAIQERAKFIPA